MYIFVYDGQNSLCICKLMLSVEGEWYELMSVGKISHNVSCTSSYAQSRRSGGGDLRRLGRVSDGVLQPAPEGQLFLVVDA